ncbi:hypothetical protein FRC12_002564 [Ceratobasidium sp. 428]|nr:hypothetical protein FRC12_002564 [Ceratobasidium sp. 428]
MSTRSGCRYDPPTAPSAPKTRSCKGTKGKKRARKADDGPTEEASSQLVFGTVTPADCAGAVPPSYTYDGGRLGVALGIAQGVQMTPQLYLQAYADASVNNGDAAGSEGPVAPVAQVVTPPEINCTLVGDISLATVNTSTPVSQYTVRSNSEIARGGCQARCDEKRARAKTVSNGTPSPESSTIVNPLSWAEEVKQARGDVSTDGPFDFENWVNPDWSRSAYLSAPTQTASNSEQKSDSIDVKAFIYEVEGNYVFSDGEYANVLNTLRSETLPTSAKSEKFSVALQITLRLQFAT